MAAEKDENLEKACEHIDGPPETEKNSQSSVKTNPKTKSASQTSKTSTCGNLKTASQRQRELLIAKHRR